MIKTAKITSKGQITLPVEIRRILKVGEGNTVVFEREGGEIIIRPARTISEFRGVLAGRRKEVDYEKMRETAKEHLRGRVAENGRK